eukprot:SAG31_NODE_10900_length_1085_cov_11.412779_3_plen_109_part_00
MRLELNGLARRLKTKYPDEPWHSAGPAQHRFWWVGQTRAWEELLAEWEAGELSEVRPRGERAYPHAGLWAINDWAIERGEARQRDLIGMTAETDLQSDDWGKRLLSQD